MQQEYDCLYSSSKPEGFCLFKYRQAVFFTQAEEDQEAIKASIAPGTKTQSFPPTPTFLYELSVRLGRNHVAILYGVISYSLHALSFLSNTLRKLYWLIRFQS